MKCRIEKRIWHDADKSADYTCLFYQLDVSDTPQRGAQLRDARWFSGALTFVVWNPAEEQFNCRVADEAPCSDGCDEYPYEFLVDNALQEGWRACPESTIER
jgi:hypothetical protein